MYIGISAIMVTHSFCSRKWIVTRTYVGIGKQMSSLQFSSLLANSSTSIRAPSLQPFFLLWNTVNNAWNVKISWMGAVGISCGWSGLSKQPKCFYNSIKTRSLSNTYSSFLFDRVYQQSITTWVSEWVIKTPLKLWQKSALHSGKVSWIALCRVDLSWPCISDKI